MENVKKSKIIATGNKTNRTFTIREYEQDGTIRKYRTLKMSKEEYEKEKDNTEQDWKQFLKGEEYYTVK